MGKTKLYKTRKKSADFKAIQGIYEAGRMTQFVINGYKSYK